LSVTGDLGDVISSNCKKRFAGFLIPGKGFSSGIYHKTAKKGYFLALTNQTKNNFYVIKPNGFIRIQSI
jgi:hypothetical protein